MALSFFVVLLAQALLMQGCESFFVNQISVLAVSKMSARPQCSQRLSCALKSAGSPVSQDSMMLDRRYALGSLAAAIALHLQPARAVEKSSASTTKSAPSEKLLHLSNDKLKEMVEADIRDRQFLVTGQLTR
jgi:hypothetical protein